MNQHGLVHGTMSRVFSRLSWLSVSVKPSRRDVDVGMLISISRFKRRLIAHRRDAGRRFQSRNLVTRWWSLSCNDGLRRVIIDCDPFDEQVCSGLIYFFLLFSSLGYMSVKGFYTTVQGSIVHEFSVITNHQEVRWYLCATAILGCAERRHAAPSGVFRDGTC